MAGRAAHLHHTAAAAAARPHTAAAHRHVEALFAAQSQLNLDYFSICSEENLMENQLDKPEKVRGFIAAQLGEIRLIDNLKFWII